MHRGQAVSQFDPFFGQPNVNRALIVDRALVSEILVLHHLFDVIGDVRAEIAAAQCEFADCHFGITNIEKHHCLNIVDVVYSDRFQLQLDHLQELAVRTLDERNDFLVWITHRPPPSRHAVPQRWQRVAHARQIQRRSPVKKAPRSGGSISPASMPKSGRMWRRRTCSMSPCSATAMTRTPPASAIWSMSGLNGS